MDHSYSDSDISLSPAHLLERIQMLRQLQLLQRGKLQKHRLEYQETFENDESSSCITEMVSHFTNNSTSYNTFRSLLQLPQSNDSPRLETETDVSKKVRDGDLIDGVSVLNLSRESPFIDDSPISTNRSSSMNEAGPKSTIRAASNNESRPDSSTNKLLAKKQISLEDMPILSPKKDFEALVLEMLQTEKNAGKSPQKKNNPNNKKNFLKRGDGMARFGVKKNDLVIQNTKSLPWRQRNPPKSQVKDKTSNVKIKSPEVTKAQRKSPMNTETLVLDPQMTLKKPEPKLSYTVLSDTSKKDCNIPKVDNHESSSEPSDSRTLQLKNTFPDKIIQMPEGKHPMLSNKGKTWAAVLTKEQNDFLCKLKQSDYYKNFTSPTKSTVSDMSCDANSNHLRQEKEAAEQNLFELLENKVTNESFNLDNSFFNRFLRKNNRSYFCSGESTPLVMQKCLASNPNLMHIFPEIHTNRHDESDSECTNDSCSSVSSCCSCKTSEPATPQDCIKNKKVVHKKNDKEVQSDGKGQNDIDNETEAMKTNIAEMNAKLETTSVLLKERLRELEDEIETFRKENVNLNKLREEVDLERQKFYVEKSTFEQKFNEEKILSEYYLAEEKEKLSKQKQMYERYVREMRGRLNKKEKDEVVQLKQEINNLKEEIRMKDAKSTSTIARLRNQIKIMEKEKLDFLKEVENLKKENRRIQHSNDITRRLTNMKYLEQINKKLNNMNKLTQSEVELSTDSKYKAFEIERQSRSRKAQVSNTMRPRAKSVPNLKVTSRYAKYFSQKDAVSDKNNTMHLEEQNSEEELDELNSSSELPNEIHDLAENNIEKMYMETFRSNSPKSNRSSKSNSHYLEGDSNPFFLRKSNSSRDSKSPTISQCSFSESKSPVSVIPQKPINTIPSPPIGSRSISHRSTSPVSRQITTDHLSTQTSNRRKSSVPTTHSIYRSTVVPNDIYREKLLSVSPEPNSKNSSKMNLNPTEIKKPDGSRELRFPNGNIKYISSDSKYSKFVYYNGDVKENFLSEGRIKYYYAETKTFHTTHADGLEVLEFPDGQVEKRYKDGSSEVRLPNGSVRYHDPKNEHVREEWRFPDGSAMSVSASGEQRIAFSNGQVEVHAKDHKRREFPDGTVKLVYNDGTSETRYASGRVRIKDKHGNLIMDSAPG